jgi:hypothetical protein
VFALGDHYLRRGNAQRALELANRLRDINPASQTAAQLRAAAQAALAREPGGSG